MVMQATRAIVPISWRGIFLPAPLPATLVRTLVFVHVDVLGVNHVAGFAGSALRAAAGTRLAGLACWSGSGTGAGRLLLCGFVERLGHLVQRGFDFFRSRAEASGVAFATVAHGFLGVLKSFFRCFHFVRG